jgi:hypothetical protein
MDVSEKNRAWQRLRTAMTKAPAHISKKYDALVESKLPGKKLKLNTVLATYLEVVVACAERPKS